MVDFSAVPGTRFVGEVLSPCESGAWMAESLGAIAVAAASDFDEHVSAVLAWFRPRSVSPAAAAQHVADTAAMDACTRWM